MGALYSKSASQQQQQQQQQLQLGNNNANRMNVGSGVGVGRGANKYDDGTISSAAASLELLSQQEMEHEFEKIYQRSHHLLQSLTHNPCEELSERIAQCLETNAKQMSNCFNEMNAYQACVAQQSSDKLVRQ